jgi:hypothetical protein
VRDHLPHLVGEPRLLVVEAVAVLPVRDRGGVVAEVSERRGFKSHHPLSRPYSGTGSPEPPNSLGKSLSFGRPSFIGNTEDA